VEPFRVLSHNVLARFIREGLLKPKAGEADFPPRPMGQQARADHKHFRGLGCEGGAHRGAHDTTIALVTGPARGVNGDWVEALHVKLGISSVRCMTKPALQGSAALARARARARALACALACAVACSQSQGAEQVAVRVAAPKEGLSGCTLIILIIWHKAFGSK